MMQRAKKAEKGASKSVFRPEQSQFGARSLAAFEEKSQIGSCGPLCTFNLMDLPLRAKPAPNRTGMPDQLKAGIESLSGMDMSGVRVHANSDKPAQLNALAYAQGNDIHLASGQEQHLPHEAWHVVQQKMGLVRPTLQAKGVGINDDPGLEQEADRMGKKAARGMPGGILQESLPKHLLESKSGSSLDLDVQRKVVVQLLSEDEQEQLKEFIQVKEMEIFFWNAPDRVNSIFGVLKEKYKDKKGKKELDRAKKEAEEKLNAMKPPQAAASPPSTLTTGKAPQDTAPSSSTSTTWTTSTAGKAPQDTASSSSISKTRTKRKLKFEKMLSENLFRYPSPPQATEEQSKHKEPEAPTLPPAGHFEDGPKNFARGHSVLSVLGISKKVTELKEKVTISIDIPGKTPTPVSYRTHLTIPNYDAIFASESVTRQVVLEEMHITVETHGEDDPRNLKFWLNERKFSGDGWTQKSKEAVSLMGDEFIKRLNKVFI